MATKIFIKDHVVVHRDLAAYLIAFIGTDDS